MEELIEGNEVNKTLGQQMLQAQAAIYAGRQALEGIMQQSPVDREAVDECRQRINSARGIVKVMARKIREAQQNEPLGENTSWMKW